MIFARVTGNVVCTLKDEKLVGTKLMLVQPVDLAGAAKGNPIVAVDSVGAGVGEDVFFVRGKEASFPFYPVEVPTDAAIVGIVDQVTLEAPASPPAQASAAEGQTRKRGKRG